MGTPSAPGSANAPALGELAGRFGLEVGQPVLGALDRFVQLLHTWNGRINLTGAGTPGAIVQEQLPDSFALAKLVPQGAHLLDVGSGGGLPAIPFGLLRPDVRLTLTEPRSRRRAFLTTALRELGLTAELRADRSEVLPAGAFDAASARAVFAPAEWLLEGSRLVRPGGLVFLFLNEDAPWSPPGSIGLNGDLRYRAGSRGHRLVAVPSTAV